MLSLEPTVRLWAGPKQASRCADWDSNVISEDGRPKIIWSYWHDVEPPDFINYCIKSWHQHAPDYEIRLLNRESVELYTGKIRSSFDKRAPQVTADWIRLKLLRDYGGIWLDASFVFLSPIGLALPEQALNGDAPFMFMNRSWTTLPSYPMTENWLISAPAKDPLVCRWFALYDATCYMRKLVFSAIKLFGLERSLFQGCPVSKHFMSCAALQLALRMNGSAKFWYQDSEAGPMMLPAAEDYDADRIADRFTLGDLNGVSSVKFNQAWRNAIIAKRAWQSNGGASEA